jgi:glycosyltransferase involved in cell wall biosynthesis
MLVSIIISNYNYAAYLADAIDSALAQTHPDVEVIVVDDGSTDDSRAVIEGYGSRVRSIFKANTGQVPSTNVAFAVSRGDVVILLDADDVLLENAAERHLDSFRDPATIVSHGYLEVVNARMEPLGKRLPFQLAPAGDYVQHFLACGPSAYPASFTSGGAWSRRFLERVMPMPEDNLKIIGPDGYLSALSPLFGRIGAVHEIVGRYRIHGNNRGPFGYSFTPEYLNARLRAYYARVAYAASRARDMGYTVDEERWLDRAGWKLLLSAHAAGLLDGKTDGVTPKRLFSAPLHETCCPLPKRMLYALMMAGIRYSPRAMALPMSKWMLDRKWGRALT